MSQYFSDILSKGVGTPVVFDHDANELSPSDAGIATGEQSSVADLKLRGTIKSLGTSSADGVGASTRQVTWHYSMCLVTILYAI